ncbi:MAG: hypothetical protein ACRENY_07615 [Candidatus Dormibacteria bacterium]
MKKLLLAVRLGVLTPAQARRFVEVPAARVSIGRAWLRRLTKEARLS